MERKLVITGKGNYSANPDIVIFTFPLEVRRNTYELALDGLMKIVNILKNAVSDSAIDVSNLKTSYFRIDTYTEYNEKTRKSEFAGFEASQKQKLELPLDNVLIIKLLNNIFKLNTPIEFKMSFGVKDKESCLQALLENAISNAKHKANIITAASGVKLKEIIAINYSFSEVHFHSDLEVDMSSHVLMEANSFPEINPEEIQLNENVTVTWRIE